MFEYYQDLMEEERSLNNKLYSNSMTTFWHNPFVHTVIVLLVLFGGWALSAGGEWQTITLGAIAAGILSYFKGKSLGSNC